MSDTEVADTVVAPHDNHYVDIKVTKGKGKNPVYTEDKHMGGVEPKKLATQLFRKVSKDSKFGTEFIIEFTKVSKTSKRLMKYSVKRIKLSEPVTIGNSTINTKIQVISMTK